MTSIVVDRVDPAEALERRTRGDRPGAVRADRPRAVALGAGLVGRPADGPDPGRPAGQGPALPVHRRAAGARRRPTSVRRHLAEYLDEAGDRRPLVAAAWPWRSPRGARPASAVLAWLARSAATHMARRFIAGSTPDEALADRPAAPRRSGWPSRPTCSARPSSARPRPRPTSRPASTCSAGWPARWRPSPEIPLIDRDDRGPIPRVNLSLKLTSLTAAVRRAPRRGDRRPASPTRLRPILRTARELGAYVHVDMEQYAHKDLTLRHLPLGPLRARVPRLARRRDRRARRTCPRPRPTCATLRDWVDAARARRSRSGWSRGRTGTTRSCTPGSSAGRCRSTCRSGRPTPATSAAPGS